MITVVDYGMGNLHSVENALRYLSIPAQVSNNPDVIAKSKKLILPGVGSFHKAMQHLNQTGIATAIKEAAAHDADILGICLGMQLLAEYGEEGAGEGNLTEGLGFIDGNVVHMKPVNPQLKIPHMGFNQVKQQPGLYLFDGINSESDFYFVHGYQFVTSASNVGGTTEYGDLFTSVVIKNNIAGVQFHPEKSQSNGLKLLRNFYRHSSIC